MTGREATGGGGGGGGQSSLSNAPASAGPIVTATGGSSANGAAMGDSWPALEEVPDVASYVLQRRMLRGWSEAIQGATEEIVAQVTRGVRRQVRRFE